MRGAMIYERANAPRNARYIELFTAAARRRGAALEVCYTDEISCGAADTGTFFLLRGEKQAFDFALVRAMRPLLSESLERAGIPAFNNSLVSRIANDKRETALYALQKGFPILPTAFAGLDCPAHAFPYPVVVKAARGCGGRQVYLCENEPAYLDALKKIAPDDAVVQPFLDAGGRDTRVYVLGGEVYQAMERYSDGADFRSNFGIHGHARPVSAPKDMLDMARCAARNLGAAFVGVDFLRGADGKTYFNEIEDAVGARMLYEQTSLDPTDDYMALIDAQIRG